MWRHLRRGQSERGELSSAVILLPIAVGLFLLVVHAALVFNGKQVVDAAAQDALNASQQFGADKSDGEDAANVTLGLAGQLDDIDVQVSKNSETVTVVVEAKVRSAFFNVANTVRSEVSGPSERFIDEADRQP